MKSLLSLCIAVLLGITLNAQNLKPYIIGYKTNESISEVVKALESKISASGLEFLGSYQPANDKNRAVIVFSSAEMIEAVNKVKGLTGFASVLRIGITVENGKTVVSYTNPTYWGNAYFRKDFSKVAKQYASLTKKLEGLMKTCGTFDGASFGSDDGIGVGELQKYRYMMGMPKFDATVKLGSFISHTEAVKVIDTNCNKVISDVKKVFKKTIPGSELVLYGFAIEGEKGEQKFLPIIDLDSPKHTAWLPYEVLVIGNEVHMLHGRYRIALSFPDLTMGTFSKIMTTPGDIQKALKQIVIK